MKGQDILLMFKMASLHARENIAPGLKAPFNATALTTLDYLDDDFASDFVAITSAELKTLSPTENILSAVENWSAAMSFKWEGWEATQEPVPDTSPTRWAECYSLRALSHSLGISKSEISNSLVRCREAGLVTNDYATGLAKVNRGELLNITEYALKYFFPVKPGPIVRGIPTGFAAPVLAKHLKSAGTLIPVWADPHGTERGPSIEPLYKTVPEAVKKDRTLYHYLALVDAIRTGGPRENTVSIKLLKAGLGL